MHRLGAEKPLMSPRAHTWGGNVQNKHCLVSAAAKKLTSFSWCDSKLDTVPGKEIK